MSESALLAWPLSVDPLTSCPRNLVEGWKTNEATKRRGQGARGRAGGGQHRVKVRRRLKAKAKVKAPGKAPRGKTIPEKVEQQQAKVALAREVQGKALEREQAKERVKEPAKELAKELAKEKALRRAVLRGQSCHQEESGAAQNRSGMLRKKLRHRYNPRMPRIHKKLQCRQKPRMPMIRKKPPPNPRMPGIRKKLQRLQNPILLKKLLYRRRKAFLGRSCLSEEGARR